MNRVHEIIFRLLVASIVLCSFAGATTLAQTPSPSPAQEATKAPETNGANTKDQANPFAPQPAAPLPPGMAGSATNDPRAKLTPGIYDAGEAAVGLKHVMLLKKPEAFQLGSDDQQT